MQTAQAQTGMNQNTAITQQLLNMTNQVNPYGSLTYSQTGTSSYVDPATGKTVTIPQFTGTTTLTPEQQAQFNQQQQFDSKFNDIALQQTDKIGGLLSTPFSYDVGEHEKWAGDLYGKLTKDQIAQQTAGMEAKLANQGLVPGTAAYDAAMGNLTYGQNKAYNDFMLGSYKQGLETALTNRNQPLNEIIGLMSGQQVQVPNFGGTPQVGVNGVDYAGLVDKKFQADSANYQNTMGGLFGLGGSLLGMIPMLSDKRTKKNVKKLGELEPGVGAYAYEYKKKFGGKGLMHIGVMAQEVEKKHPEAVTKGADGYRRVDYDRLAEALA